MKKSILLLLILSGTLLLKGQSDSIQTDTVFLPVTATENAKKLIFTFDIRENIAAPIWRTTKEAFDEAEEMKADLILINMNTYGGEVSAADSIRTRILNSKIPVYVFINDNAASAGALIAIACDSIYMKPSAKIGAATVVNQTGEQVPDKYQSYMRATMRATAEAHGKDTLINGRDTTYRWRRNPHIAEAMVDPVIVVPEISDSGQVLTFTASEALANGYCEGIVDSRREIMELNDIKEYEFREYKASGLDKLIGFLIHPAVSGILIMIIIGGIYFELQSPGIGFPLAAAIIAALLYFAPLYIEGLAESWELLLFIAGVVLLAVEIFAIPGFGVAGISGIILIVTGLTLSLVDNVVFERREFTGEGLTIVLKAFSLVLVSLFAGLLGSLWAAKKLLTSTSFAGGLALQSEQDPEKGFIGVSMEQRSLVGKEGVAHTVLRPSGKVRIGEKLYDAKAEYGMIEKGAAVRIIRYETGQIYVIKI